MSKYPILLITGQAGSGKDTVADLIIKYTNSNVIKIALADPMKRFVKHAFNVPDESLWGPSELRNTRVDPSFIISTGVKFNSLVKKIDKFLEELNIYDGVDWCSDVRTLLKYKKLKPDDFTVRFILQNFGTDFVRSIHGNDYWINYAITQSQLLLEGGKLYSPQKGITDCKLSRYNQIIISDGRFRNEVLAVQKINGTNIKVVRPTKDTPHWHQSEQEQSTMPDYWFDEIIINNNSLDKLEDTIYNKVKKNLS